MVSNNRAVLCFDSGSHIFSFVCFFIFYKQRKSIEVLEVNDDIRTRCYDALRVALGNLPNALHGLLFVGTKLLAVYSKHKAFELTSGDIFLLIVYFIAQFHPHGKRDMISDIYK